MPEVCYQTQIPMDRQAIWGFVKDMDNWAPLLTGYQAHEITDDRNSIWTLKGDVGILSRTVKLGVKITEWVEPDRVVFELTGLNEAVHGGGRFVLEPCELGESNANLPVPATGWWAGLIQWVFRVIFRRVHGVTEGVDAQQKTGEGTQVTVVWEMEAEGPTAPLVNAMLEPALLPAAEDLANKIAARLVEGVEAP